MDCLDPSPYCSTLPDQLKWWDSTSLRAYQTCPRKYYYSIVKGYRSGLNWDIWFGLLYHDAVEQFDRLMLTSVQKEEAIERIILDLLERTWDTDGDKPVSGVYVQGWRCNNWVPGKRSKYNCDAARQWWSGHISVCPKCSGPVTNRQVWAPEHKKKNRYTLLSAVLTYCDEQSNNLKPIVFPDGQVALELSFNVPLPLSSPDGDPYILCGHLDSMVSVAGEYMVRERKTAGSSLGVAFFDRYAPDTQIDIYDLAGNIMFGPTLHPEAVMVEVMSVSTNTPTLARGLVTITEGRREETLQDAMYWIKQAEANAKENYWPKNNASCNQFMGCQFRRVCKEAPESRQKLLDAYYNIEMWNPRKSREQ